MVPDKVIQYHSIKHKMAVEPTREVFSRLVAFMDEYMATRISRYPGVEVDEALHSFVLNSSEYRTFCLSRYGAFVDHVPSFEHRGTDVILCCGLDSPI